MPHIEPVWVETVLILLMILLVCLFMWSVLALFNNKKKTVNQESFNDKKKAELKEAAQKALNAIDSERIPTDKRSDGSKHVFNNGLLKIHRNVLEDLLKDVGGFDEQFKNLMNDIVIPLSQTHRDAISTMVVNFSSDEFYVDYNADVYGEYAKVLRKALVDFLKADTSVNKDVSAKIQDEQNKVEFITHQMVLHEVYVDPMARDRWEQNKKKVKDRELYNQIRVELQKMFQNILQNFQAVSVKIRDFRRTNNWNG